MPIRFLQIHDPEGYRIDVEPAPVPKRRRPVRKWKLLGGKWEAVNLEEPEPDKTLAEGVGPVGPTTWIKRNSPYKLIRSKPVRFEKEPIFKKLARTEQTPEGALAFVQRYGFLSNAVRRERVEDICNHIQTMQWLVSALRNDERDAINFWLAGYHLYQGGDGKRRLSKARTPVRRGLRIGEDEADRPQPQDWPPTFIEALFLQCILDGTGGKHSKLCLRPRCGNWFYYGPNTTRRSTAKYCTPGCRVKHFEMRKGGSK